MSKPSKHKPKQTKQEKRERAFNRRAMQFANECAENLDLAEPTDFGD